MVKEQAKMTAEDARTFGSYSVANAVRVTQILTCGCEPYRDVFTFRRWLAQGFAVQRGQHAVKIPVVKMIERENRETGERETRRVLGSGAVFCRCQVAPVAGRTA